MAHALKIFLSILFFLLLSFGIYAKIVADSASDYAATAIKAWTCQQQNMTMASIEKVSNRVESALATFPIDADLHYYKGQLESLKALRGSVWDDDTQSGLSRSERSYSRATDLRPVWAIAYLNQYQARILSKKFDKKTRELQQILETLGKWQTDVQKKYLWYVVGTWSYYNKKDRARLLRHFSDVVNNRPLEEILVAAGYEYDWLENIFKMNLSEEKLEKIMALLGDEVKLKSMNVQRALRNAYC